MIRYTPAKNGETKLNKNGETEYITFPALERYPELVCAFSTRKGGVSSGMFSSMNLGRMEMDSRENVTENYRIFCDAVKIDVNSIVISDQQHTDHIMKAGRDDRGKGLFKERGFEAVDGFITDEKDVALCLLFADCVPVILYDPVHRAAGLVHSGWRGTKAHISEKALRMMNEEYGTDPSDTVSVIAPSICRSCYEVSEDLYEAFSQTFDDDDLKRIFDKKNDGRFQLDLWLANKIILEKAGVPEKNIHVTDLCTCCNSSLLFSHRASKGRRGNLAAVVMIR